MEKRNYQPPVDQLLNYGSCQEMDYDDWPNYSEELGITSEFIPDLILMATDEALLHKDDEDSLDIWAPIHACRTLGQLQAQEAIEPLLKLFDESDNDWFGEDLPKIYAMIGVNAIPALSDYFTKTDNEMVARVTALDCLQHIAQLYPDHRSECIAIITQELEKFNENDPELNAFLVSTLTDLKVVEAAPLMERVFASDRIATLLTGDWDNIQVELGLKSISELPPRKSYLSELFTELSSTPSIEEISREPVSRRSAKQKTKAKRKQAAQSRKKNRKKK